MFRLVVLLLISSVSCFAQAFPQILDWQNSPVIGFENKKQAELKKNGLLKSPFAVVTKERDRLTLKLNTFDKIEIFGNSKVQILDILSEAAFVPDFYLLNGRVRIKNEFRGLEKKELNMMLRTPFFDYKLQNEADFYVILNMAEPSIEVKVIEGELDLEFFAYETKPKLKGGQSVKFVGELADDKASIRYDFLLNNKKVPKGKMFDVVAFDASVYIAADEKARQAEIARIKAAQQKKREKIRKQKEFEASFLCKRPFAHLNQCSWFIEGGKCYRQRCNANGSWGDVTERPMSSDCKSSEARACDY